MRRRALGFIVLMGLVSLLSDITYEGARSVTGPFLATLGAPAAAVGFVAGFGELVGYGFRLFAGLIADRTGRYWTITFIGYAVNLLAVPALALAGEWPAAAALMIAERFGKSLRAPARDALLSRATAHVGHGWGFGLHEAMDQIGAVTGPLIVAAVLHGKGGYRESFALLLIPALLALCVLAAARIIDRRSGGLTAAKPLPVLRGQRRAMWFYLAGVACVAAATADFPLIAYHFEKTSLFAPAMIPVLYATAMGVDALSALLFGLMFDRFGSAVLVVPTAMMAFFAPLVFSGTVWGAVAGVALWGVGMGAQESVLKSAVATLSEGEKRGAAYGLFSAVYGISWFAGSAVMGLIYGWSIAALTAFCVCGQLAALPLFYSLRRDALK